MTGLAAVVVMTALALMGAGGATDAARDYNRVAIEAFKAGDYEKALENFERAFELLPDPKVRLNLGVTNENLNRLDEARDHYETFLRENPKSDKAPVVKDKLGNVEKKMKQWGKVLIQVSPAPDVVKVDMRAFRGVPVKVWMEPGRHKLVVQKEGMVPHQQELVVEPGVRFEVKVDLVAVPQPEKPVATADPPPQKDPDPATADPKPETNTAPTSETAAPAEGKGTSVLGWVLRAAGGGSAGVAALALLAGVLGGVTTGVLYGVRLTVPGTDAYTTVMAAGVVGGVVVLAAGLLLGLVLGGVGVAVLVASFFV